MDKPDEKRLKPSWMAQVTAPPEYVVEYLERTGVGHKKVAMDPKMCKPLQDKVDLKKAQGIQEAMDQNKPLGPIFISGDDEILDGHHRAYAAIKHPEVEQVACIKIYMEYKDAMRLLNKVQDKFEFEQEQEAQAGGGKAIGGEPVKMVDEEDRDESATTDVKPDGAAEQATDEHLPAEVVPQAQGPAQNLVSYETAGNNPKSVKAYKAMNSINSQARTGDFLLLEKKPTMKFEFNLDFENLLEIAQEALENITIPTEAVLQDWLPGADYAQESKSQGLPQEVWMSREVNRLALQKGFDGVLYGDKLVQVINKIV
jgi:hypothetical protein